MNWKSTKSLKMRPVVEIYLFVGFIGCIYGDTNFEHPIFNNRTLSYGQEGGSDINGRILELERAVKQLEARCMKQETLKENLNLEREKRSIANFVAFTAYLDHVIDHLGIKENVVYNKVLLNAGGGYSTSTGVFTCPVEGYYAFSFYVYTNGVQQFVARLSVDGSDKVDGIADTYFDKHEAQGGNFAVLYLHAGQQVSIQNERWPDTAVDGSNGSRMSTFTGYLIQA